MNLFHYTSQSAFISILKTNTLRLSDVECCNDSMDGTYLQEIYRATIADLRKSRPGKTAKAFLDQLESEAEQALGLKTFVACFSELADDLRQWTCYGGTIPGYSLRFVSDEIEGTARQLTRFKREDMLWCGRVSYDGLQSVGDEICSRLDSFVHSVSLDPDNITNAASAVQPFVQMRADIRACRYKHHSFGCEKEFRIAVTGNMEYEAHPPPDYDCPDYANVRARLCSTDFVCGKSYIKPVLNLHFGRENMKKLLKEVWIGPCPAPKLAAKKARHILKELGFHVEVLSSESPFRGW